MERITIDTDKKSFITELVPLLNNTYKPQAIKLINVISGIGLEKSNQIFNTLISLANFDIVRAYLDDLFDVKQKIIYVKIDREEFIKNLTEALKQGGKLHLVKLIKDSCDLGLKDAKNFLENNILPILTDSDFNEKLNQMVIQGEIEKKPEHKRIAPYINIERDDSDVDYHPQPTKSQSLQLYMLTDYTKGYLVMSGLKSLFFYSKYNEVAYKELSDNEIKGMIKC